ncbi:acyltransferase [uncultured Jatrophihabitans sp.]|uniref:acyltransferase n=1 Tax=uncultured Jatrophihabitans sp. TaxID=1610747 RepID=UPI0035CAD8D3
MSGLSSAIRTFTAGRTWQQWARLANFAGYDAAERFRADIAANVRISPTASFRNGERITVGAGSHIGQGSMLWAGDETGRITLGDHVLLAPRVFITASNYDVDSGLGPVMDLAHREADVTIGANTWLGTNVVVVAGVTIGAGAIVAAGAVVTGDVAENSVCGGVPARHIRYRGAPK